MGSTVPRVDAVSSTTQARQALRPRPCRVSAIGGRRFLPLLLWHCPAWGQLLAGVHTAWHLLMLPPGWEWVKTYFSVVLAGVEKSTDLRF